MGYQNLILQWWASVVGRRGEGECECNNAHRPIVVNRESKINGGLLLTIYPVISVAFGTTHSIAQKFTEKEGSAFRERQNNWADNDRDKAHSPLSFTDVFHSSK